MVRCRVNSNTQIRRMKHCDFEGRCPWSLVGPPGLGSLNLALPDHALGLVLFKRKSKYNSRQQFSPPYDADLCILPLTTACYTACILHCYTACILRVTRHASFIVTRHASFIVTRHASCNGAAQETRLAKPRHCWLLPTCNNMLD